MRLETPSPGRELSGAQKETPNQGNETLINVDTVVQGTIGGSEIRPQLFECSQISNEIQVWTESFEQKTMIEL